MDNWRCSHGWLRGEQCEICNAPKRPWVGLTWEDMPEEHAGDSNFLSGARWAEAKLKERNT